MNCEYINGRGGVIRVYRISHVRERCFRQRWRVLFVVVSTHVFSLYTYIYLLLLTSAAVCCGLGGVVLNGCALCET